MESKAYSIDEIKGKLHAAVDLIQGDGSNMLITSRNNGDINLSAFCDSMMEACATLLAALSSCVDDLDEKDKAMVRNAAHCILNGMELAGGDEDASE